MSCSVNFLTFGFLNTINILIFNFELLQAKLHFLKTGKRSHLVHFGYYHDVIKYLMSDIMKAITV